MPTDIDYDSMAESARQIPPPSSVNPLVPAAIIGGGAAALGAGGLALKAFPKSKLMMAGGKLLIKQLPGARLPMDIVDFLREAKGQTPTRPITEHAGGEQTPRRAPAQTKNPRYTGGRGASGPELERRAAAMAKAKMVQVAPVAEDDLTAQLQASIQGARAAKGLGLSSAERAAAFGGARAALSNPGSVAGGTLGLLGLLLGAPQIPQQLAEAGRFVDEQKTRQLSPQLKALLQAARPI